MKVEVRYFSRGGNTKKLAEAIAEAVGVEALTTAEPLKEDVDILFLGSSVYAYGVDDEIRKFIEGIDVKVGKVVNFSTAAIINSTYKQVSKLVKDKGLTMAEEEFYCKGSFLMMHKGRPNAQDCLKAANFARRIVKG